MSNKQQSVFFLYRCRFCGGVEKLRRLIDDNTMISDYLLLADVNKCPQQRTHICQERLLVGLMDLIGGMYEEENNGER